MKKYIKILWEIWNVMLTVSVFAKVLVIVALHFFDPTSDKLKWLFVVVVFIFSSVFLWLVYKKTPLIIGNIKQIIFAFICGFVYSFIMWFFWESIKPLKFGEELSETIKLILLSFLTL